MNNLVKSQNPYPQTNFSNATLLFNLESSAGCKKFPMEYIKESYPMMITADIGYMPYRVVIYKVNIHYRDLIR